MMAYGAANANECHSLFFVKCASVTFFPIRVPQSIYRPVVCTARLCVIIRPTRQVACTRNVLKKEM